MNEIQSESIEPSPLGIYKPHKLPGSNRNCPYKIIPLDMETTRQMQLPVLRMSLGKSRVR